MTASVALRSSVATAFVVLLGCSAVAAAQQTPPSRPKPAPVRPTASTALPALESADVQALRKQADEGNAGAQWLLGLRYEEGISVRQDYTTAVSWYRKAAEQGLASAQSSLGYALANGLGIPKD